MMECKQAQKMIPYFLQDDLETDELREIIEHIDKCEECREELSIEFLVREGLLRLESGNAFDLQQELKGRMESAQHTLRMRENMRWFLYALEGLVGVGVAAVVALIVFLN